MALPRRTGLMQWRGSSTSSPAGTSREWRSRDNTGSVSSSIPRMRASCGAMRPRRALRCSPTTTPDAARSATRTGPSLGRTTFRSGAATFATFNCAPASVQPAGSSLVYGYPYTGTGVTNNANNVGHSDQAWDDSRVQSMYLEGIKWVLRMNDAPVQPHPMTPPPSP